MTAKNANSVKLAEMIKGFIESEEAYAKLLGDVQTLFVVPLRADAGTKKEIVPREALPSIFGNIELIAQLSQDLVQALRSNPLVWDAEKGRVVEPREFWATLFHFLPQMQSYRQYLENYEVAQQTMARYSASKKMQDFIQARTLWRPDIVLKTQLEAPTKHVRGMSLFVARCEKLTALDDASYMTLTKCSTILAELNNLLVEARTDAEHLLRLKDIEKRITGLGPKFASTGRRGLREGYLDKVNPKGKHQKRWFVLLNDQLLWAAPQSLKGGMALRGSLDLDKILVKPLVGKETGFEIVRMDNPKKYPMIAESVESRNRWVADLNSIVDQYLEQGKQQAKTHAPGSAEHLSIPSSAAAGSPRPMSGEVKLSSSPQPGRRSEYRSGMLGNLGGSSSRLSGSPMLAARQKVSLQPSSPLLGKPVVSDTKLDLVDDSVPQELRDRLQALVTQARQWTASSDRLEVSVKGIDRRLTVLEISHRVVA